MVSSAQVDRPAKAERTLIYDHGTSQIPIHKNNRQSYNAFSKYDRRSFYWGNQGMVMEQTKRRHSFLVILSTVMAFALLSTDIFLPALIDPFLAASDTMN